MTPIQAPVAATIAATSSPSTLSAKVESLEANVEKILSVVSNLSPLLSLIPGASGIIADVEGVASVADMAMHAMDGSQPSSAALSASQIATSTGNATLDSRLAAIETYIEQFAPMFASLAKEFGYTAPTSTVVSAATVAANSVVETSSQNGLG